MTALFYEKNQIYYTVLLYQWEWMRILDAKEPLKIKEHVISSGPSWMLLG